MRRPALVPVHRAGIVVQAPSFSRRAGRPHHKVGYDCQTNSLTPALTGPLAFHIVPAF